MLYLEVEWDTNLIGRYINNFFRWYTPELLRE